MKIIAIITACMVFGCASVYAPPAAPVCARPEAIDSVLCATATRLGYTVEQIDSMFLDASLVGIGGKMFKAADLRRALQDARQWVVERDVVNIQGLTNYLVKRAEMDPALAMLLSRRLGLINLPILGLAPLTAFDKQLVLAGIDHQLEQLRFF
jgi:hypothetical protein